MGKIALKKKKVVEKKRKIFKQIEIHRTMKTAEIKDIRNTIRHGQLDIAEKSSASKIIHVQCIFVEWIHSLLCAFTSLQ